MQALIILNVTTLADLAADGDTEAAAEVADQPGSEKALAIFRRFPKDDEAPIEKGDRLDCVGRLDFPDITKDTPDYLLAVCRAAYVAGNSPYEGDVGVTEYRAWKVRSLSVGDVVLTEGRAFAVAPMGWTEIDARFTQFKVIGPLVALTTLAEQVN